ncbi:MAG: hypothetical protein ACYTFI_11930, partial [Planctomycetota bacterium]
MADDDRPRSDDANEKPPEPEADGAPTPKSGTPSVPDAAPGPGSGEKAGDDKGTGEEKKGEQTDEKSDDKKEKKGAGRVPEHELASPNAIEKLKERVARDEKV